MTKHFSLLCLCLGFSAFLHSLPQQGAVVSGKAEIVQTSDLMQITTSDRAILSWDAFSIGKAEALQFLQPSDRSAVLNRVTGLDLSKLDGSLQANGQVYLINPNGLIIGKDALINTAGFVGTTLQIPDVDFLNNTDLLFQGDSTASIIHLGTIQSSQGPVTLMAHKIENAGTIEANGQVSLLAGHEILLNPCGDLLHIRPDIQADGIESSGAIQTLQTTIASDGLHSLGIKQEGSDALAIVVTGGKILLRAENSPLTVSGELTASEGSVHLLGNTVHLKNGTVVDVSGAKGGGEILVGGDYRGLNSDIPNALVTVVDEQVVLKADATLNGNGGKVIVWSDQATFYRGQSYVRGGNEGGDGGFTEVSGKYLDFLGSADSSAAFGKTGTLLLDPIDITISTAANSNVTGLPPPPPVVANPYTILYTGTPANINNTALQNALGVNDVIVDATQAGAGGGSITVDAATTVTWATAQALTLKADTFILVNGTLNSTSHANGFNAITMTNSAAPLAAGYAGVTIGATGTVQSIGGNIVITGTGVPGTLQSNVNGVSVLFGGTLQTLSDFSTPEGNMTVTGTGGAGTGSNNCGISIAGTLNSDSPFTILTGQGGGVLGSGGSNHGVAFTNTSTIILEPAVAPVLVTLTGTGGVGGAVCDGVFIQAASFDVGIDVLFTNCTGGTSSGGSNVGVFINVGATGSGGTISFSSITGGTSGVGGNGNNHGVELLATDFVAGGAWSFTNIKGGDSGNGTPSNHGVFFAGNSTLTSIPGFTMSNIQSGAGGADNIGFYMSGGFTELLDVPTVSLTATSLGTGSGNVGIQLDTGAKIITTTGPISLTGTASSGTGSGNAGVLMASGAALNSPISISLTGTSTGTSSQGIAIETASTLTSTGPVTLIGTSNSGAGSTGILMSGASTLTSSGSVTLTGTSTSGTSSIGIQMTGASSMTAPGAISLTGTGSSQSNGILLSDSFITGTIGAITLKSPQSSMLFENGSTIQSTTGNILAISDVNINDPAGITISSTAGGTITLVVDNAFPAPPGVGPGIFNIPNTTLTTTGAATLKLYGGEVDSGIFPATLNGAPYVLHLHQEDDVYFPGGVYPAGDPYFIYYKNLPTVLVAKAVNNFSLAIAEAFQSWDNNWYKDYLDQDRYPPAYTPKGMNMVIPSLILLDPPLQQKLSFQESTKPKSDLFNF